MLCLAAEGNITGLSSHSHNRMLQGGAQMTAPAMASLIAAQKSTETGTSESAARDATQCYSPPSSGAASAVRAAALRETSAAQTRNSASLLAL